MRKETITYTDYNGVTRTEDFYFNLSKAELVEMQTSMNGGLSTLLEKIVAEQDMKHIMEYFKEVILRSYGEKSLDGKRFIKSQELRNAFTQTEAYSELFIKLCSDPEAAAAFVNGVVPQMDNAAPVAKPPIELATAVKQ